MTKPIYPTTQTMRVEGAELFVVATVTPDANVRIDVIKSDMMIYSVVLPGVAASELSLAMGAAQIDPVHRYFVDGQFRDALTPYLNCASGG